MGIDANVGTGEVVGLEQKREEALSALPAFPLTGCEFSFLKATLSVKKSHCISLLPGCTSTVSCFPLSCPFELHCSLLRKACKVLSKPHGGFAHVTHTEYVNKLVFVLLLCLLLQVCLDYKLWLFGGGGVSPPTSMHPAFYLALFLSLLLLESTPCGMSLQLSHSKRDDTTVFLSELLSWAISSCSSDE